MNLGVKIITKWEGLGKIKSLGIFQVDSMLHKSEFMPSGFVDSLHLLGNERN